MYDFNGWQQQRPPIKRPARLKTLVRDVRTRLQSWPAPARLAFALLLIVLAASLLGCATTSAPPAITPRNPEPPPTRLSESPPDYLSNAQAFISEWRKLLQELIQKPAN